MTRRLAALARRGRYPIAIAWILAVLVAGIFASTLPARLSGGGWSVTGSQSAAVDRALQNGYLGRGVSSLTVVVHDRWYVANTRPFATRVHAVMNAVEKNRTLEVRSSYGWSTLGSRARANFIGKDQRTAIDMVGLGVPDGRARQELPAVQSELVRTFADQGLDVSLVSAGSFWGEVNSLSEKSLLRTELITLPLILLVLVLLFGGVAAALVCLAVGLSSIVFTMGVLSVLAGHYELSLFVENAATMLGLGVGVDYSLFMTARFKEELKAGSDVDSAVAATLRTSGHTVLFSGATVVAAMSTLFLVPLGVIQSIALGAVVVVAFSVLTSVLLLPALLHLLGRRIEWGAVLPRRGAHRRDASLRWEAFAGRIMRRPVLFLTLSILGLLAVAAPSLGLRNFTPDARIIPTSSPVRAGFTTMQHQFGVGSSSPVQVLVTGKTPLTAADDGAVLDLQTRLRRLTSVARVDSALDVLSTAAGSRPLSALSPPARRALPSDVRQSVDYYASADGRQLLFSVLPNAPASDTSTQRLMTDIRSLAARNTDPRLTIQVGGETADGVDSNNVINKTMPVVVLAMLTIIYLFLMVSFRSVLLPLKAILINLLSVGASYGALVVVFQRGLGAGLFGFEKTGFIQNFVPVLLLTLLFSLSTDYEVFLLNRVKEEYQKTGDNVQSVARGLARTAPLISGAALLMVVVFGAFSFAGILPMKQLGFGMAVAIAIDSTVIRLVVVPAAMRLMGSWNWWFPRLAVPHRVALARSSAHGSKGADSSTATRRASSARERMPSLTKM